jgi:hypothetical protein
LRCLPRFTPQSKQAQVSTRLIQAGLAPRSGRAFGKNTWIRAARELRANRRALSERSARRARPAAENWA